MNNKLNVAVIFGGISTEHEVSIQSAKSIIMNMDREKYEIIPILITKEGKWILWTGKIEDLGDRFQTSNYECIISPDRTKKGLLKIRENEVTYIDIDVVFPVLHGLNGEDGTIQGLLELANIPYVGCGVFSSSVCMDKSYAKKIAFLEGIPQGHFLTIYKYDYEEKEDYYIRKIESEFSYPCFIKPCNAGSSVGITKAHNREQLIEGIGQAFLYDMKILIEEFIDGKDVECSVLGNENPIASCIGEIRPSREFYDYEAKYLDDSSELIIPAKLDMQTSEEIKNLAIKLYKAFDCSGMARVDFFVDKYNKVYFNEVNTIPGFTNISMYPKLWENEGIKFSELIDKLIELSLEKWHKKQQIKLIREG